LHTKETERILESTRLKLYEIAVNLTKVLSSVNPEQILTQKLLG